MQLVNLNNEQRTQVTDCLANALALLTDDSAGANDVLGFQKMIDSWKESISVLKPNSSSMSINMLNAYSELSDTASLKLKQ